MTEPRPEVLSFGKLMKAVLNPRSVVFEDPEGRAVVHTFTPEEGCMDCGYMGGCVNDVYDSEGEWAGAEWIECPCSRIRPYFTIEGPAYLSDLHKHERDRKGHLRWLTKDGTR